MRFKGLDLNLMVALEALLSTRSVARSAERLNLSQPAMSAALARLRYFFDDPLLILEGKRFHLTPAAHAILPRVQAWLGEADAMIGVVSGFDPATSRRTFRIIASEYTTITLLMPVAQRLFDTAPGLTLDIIPPDTKPAAPLHDGSVDLVIGPEAYGLDEHPSDTLFEERYVIAGWSENPIFQHPLQIDDVANARFAVSTFGPNRTPSYGDRQLDAIIGRRHIEISTSSFSALPLFLPSTQRIALLYERLAAHFAAILPIMFAAVPFEMPTTRFVMHYSRARSGDDGLSWLREIIRATALEPKHRDLSQN